MKVFLIIGESRFYQPDFVASFLRETKDEVVGAILVTKAPPKADLNKYIFKNLYVLRFNEIFKLGLFTIKAIILDLFARKEKDQNFYSVETVYKCFDLDYFKVESSINKKEILDRIREKNPDVIISSNPLIFKEEILSLPKICCINRHSSLLPEYGGLWPVFHALREGAKNTGVSVHTMTPEIDKGIVLAQYKVPIYKNDSVSDLYSITFRLSSLAVLDALDKIRNNDFTAVNSRDHELLTPSYFSNPTKDDWAMFRENFGKF